MICTIQDFVMHSFDICRERRLVVFMQAVLTANSIRAARGLAGLGRTQAAELLEISVVTLTIVEGGGHLSAKMDERIRTFFDSAGIQLFGWIDVTTNSTFGEGVKWKRLPTARFQRDIAFWPDRDIQNDQIRAARALLRLTVLDVADAVKSSRNTISQVESGKLHRRDTNERLRSFFESEGLEFVGVADTSARTLIGGGVRRRLPPDAPAEISQAILRSRDFAPPG